METRALLLVALVLLAGCGGSVEEIDTTTVQTTAQTTTTTDATTKTTQETTAPTIETTVEPTTVEDTPNNPWGKENVTVAVWGSYNQSRDFIPLVNETLEYWNENASEYADYNATFKLTPNNRNTDIVVEFVPVIPECGRETGGSTVGCAPLFRSYSTPDKPEKVLVVGGYSDESTVQILKHEFGHVMGIEHNNEPMPLMEPIAEHTYLSQPDAEDREFPWRDREFTVHLDGEKWTSEEEREAPDQIEHALEYYEDGADGYLSEDISFEMTENRSEADITISWPDSLECTSMGVQDEVCGGRWYQDTDTDDAAEYYSKLEIQIGNIDTDLTAWYVGYWIAYGLGMEDEDEIPPPFVDADYDTASGKWWA